jgi:hypothetical protein
MGADCRKVGDLQDYHQFTTTQPQIHPAFGNIFHLKCDRSKTEKAIKRLPCPNESVLSALQKRIEFAKECDNNMTLVQIYDYDIIDQYSEDLSLWDTLNTNKSDFYCNRNKNDPFILLHFQYFSAESCLS